MESMAVEKGYGFASFDYAGYGKSGGEAKLWQLEEWLQNALDVFDEINAENNYVMGYSMGGYLALALALLRPAKTKGVLGLMPGFGQSFVQDRKDKQFIADLGGKIKIHVKINESPFYSFIDQPLDINVPAFMLTSLGDETVNYQSSLSILKNIKSENATVLMLKDAPHHPVNAQSLKLLLEFIENN